MFHALGFCHDTIFADSSKIEGIEGNRLLREGEIRRDPATIALVKFFTCVIAGSIVFERVAELTIGLVRKRAVDYWKERIFGIFFSHC